MTKVWVVVSQKNDELDISVFLNTEMVVNKVCDLVTENIETLALEFGSDLSGELDDVRVARARGSYEAAIEVWKIVSQLDTSGSIRQVVVKQCKALL